MLLHPLRILHISLVVLLCAGSVTAQDAAIKERPAFRRMLAAAVTPIPGNGGGVLQTAEVRFVATFRRPAYSKASFDTYFYSNDVGGILVRDESADPGKTLKLDALTFHLDESKNPAVVVIKIGAAGEQVELSVEASLIALAARMAADDQLVLLTMAVGSDSDESSSAEEMLAIHPAIAHHRLAIAAATIDDSLGSALELDATYWVLSESPWQLSTKSFNNSEDLLTLECRRGETKIEIPNLTADWKRQLNPKQLAALRQLNDFFAVYRLINAAAEVHLQGFPEDEFISLLKRVQPHYEAQAVTIEEENEFQKWLSHR